MAVVYIEYKCILFASLRIKGVVIKKYECILSPQRSTNAIKKTMARIRVKGQSVLGLNRPTWNMVHFLVSDLCPLHINVKVTTLLINLEQNLPLDNASYGKSYKSLFLILNSTKFSWKEALSMSVIEV